jgi:hypothetical protein
MGAKANGFYLIFGLAFFQLLPPVDLRGNSQLSIRKVSDLSFLHFPGQTNGAVPHAEDQRW